MDVATAEKSVAPFESASELREEHAHLLELLDAKLVHEASAKAEAAALTQLDPDIRRFVERGAATGAYIEEITERTACQTLLDYWTSSLSHAGVHLRSVRLAPFDREQLPDLKDKPCPYVGLEAFQDPTFFFGRDADVEELVGKLRETSLVVVLGASGSGKSSLVIAGVLPAVAAKESKQAVRVIPPFVPGNAVLDHLVNAVQQGRENTAADVAAEVTALHEDFGHLSAMLGGEPARPTLMTIDQFEEVFTLSTPADREALVGNLARLLQAGCGHRVILTVREEFRSQIVSLLPLASHLGRAWYSMRPMGYDALRAAIEEPAKRQNLQFQSGIVDDLAKKVLGQPAALPLLQFALRSLWEARDRNRITWEVYRRVGDPLNALNTSAERFYEAQPQETRDEVKRILLELVRVDELLEAYRQPVPESRLLQAGKANTRDVIQLLAKNDYIRITSGSCGAEAVADVKHESLVRNWPRFVGWIDEKRHQVRQRLALTQAAARWDNSGRPEEGLLTGWQLESAKDQPDLSAVEKAFVQASTEAIDRERQRAKRRYVSLVAAAAALAVVAMVVAGLLLWQMSEIKRQAEEIRQQDRAKMRVMRAVALEPLRYVNDQYDLALLLNIEANRLAPDMPEVLRSLLPSLTTNLELEAILHGQSGPVRAVRVSPDGKVLASASYDQENGQGVIFLRDAPSSRMLSPPLRGHTDTIYAIAFGADGKTLASASHDKTVLLWSIETRQVIKTLPHGSIVFSVAINKDGTLLAAAEADGRVTLWDLKDLANPRKTFLDHSLSQAAGPKREVSAVAFSPDGALLASGGQDGRILLWDVQTRKPFGKPLEVNDEVFSVAFSHDGQTIASGSRNGHVDVWNVGTRSKLSTASNHLRGVFGVAFSHDDAQLATVSTDRSVHVVDLKRPEAAPQQLKGYAKEFYSVDFTAEGRLATGAGNGKIVLWHLPGIYPFGTRIASQSGRDPGSAFTVDGRTLFWHSRNEMKFLPVELGQSSIQSEAALHQAEIALSVSSPSGEHLVTVGSDNSVEFWDLIKRRPLRTIVDPSNNDILAATFSADSRTLAISQFNREKDEGEVRLLNMPDGTSERILGRWPSTRIWALASSPKKNLLAVGTGTIVLIWNLDTGKQTASFYHEKEVYSLAFSPDGKILASGGLDSVVRLLDVERGSAGISEAPALEGHTGAVMSIAFSPDGKWLASGSKDRSVLLWSVDKRQQLTTPILGPVDAVSRIAFSNPDGRWMVSSDFGGTIDLWTLNVPTLLFRACEVVRRNLDENEWKRFFEDEPFHISCPGAAAEDADAMALLGNSAEAERLFDAALIGALQVNEPEVANKVCWLGGVDEFALRDRFVERVKQICEQSVERAPEERKDLARDSRGLVRALTGDKGGAMADFTATVAYLERLPDRGGFSDLFVQRRKDWIAALSEGRNPFDKRLLNALRTEVY